MGTQFGGGLTDAARKAAKTYFGYQKKPIHKPAVKIKTGDELAARVTEGAPATFGQTIRPGGLQPG